MSKIHKMAEEIRKAESEKNKSSRAEVEAEAERTIRDLEAEFLHTFPQLLPILQEEGITWRGGLQDKRYPSLKGSFIEFTYKGKTLKMDFNNRGSYRFEFLAYQGNKENPSYGKMTFGKWPATRFITWLDENLIKKIII